VPSIADYSLGQYKAKLSPAQKQDYYGGTANFMARYFADQSREYTVAKYEIGDASPADGDDVTVQTKVFLMSGQSYTVVWRISPRKGGGYKVMDAKILGFSLIYLQRGIFTSFLSKRNGDVAQLVAALNR
jgi:phospholipid transport system substrate-binding protein